MIITGRNQWILSVPRVSEDKYLYYVFCGDVYPVTNGQGVQLNTSQVVTLSEAQSSGLHYWPSIFPGLYNVTSPIWYYKQCGILIKASGTNKAQALSLFIDVNGVQVPKATPSNYNRFAYFNYGENAYWSSSTNTPASDWNGTNFIFLGDQKVQFNTYKPIEQYKTEVIQPLIVSQTNDGNGFLYKTLAPNQSGIVKHDLSRTANVSGINYQLVKCEALNLGEYTTEKALAENRLDIIKPLPGASGGQW